LRKDPKRRPAPPLPYTPKDFPRNYVVTKNLIFTLAIPVATKFNSAWKVSFISGATKTLNQAESCPAEVGSEEEGKDGNEENW